MSGIIFDLKYIEKKARYVEFEMCLAFMEKQPANNWYLLANPLIRKESPVLDLGDVHLRKRFDCAVLY